MDKTRLIPRVDSVDLLRGIVMVIMLLDHTRDFVHDDVLRFDPTDMSRTYPSLFFTRWITHFCAPVFVFLAGTGSYFQVARGKSKSDLSRFLVSRGLWLILLEFTVVRFAAFWEFGISQFFGAAQVIWAIGWSMLALALLVHLPIRAIGAFGITMIALHNTLDAVSVTPWQGPGSPVPGVLAKLWMALHQGGPVPLGGWPSPVIYFLYPLIPWIGVMAAGYAFGRVYDWSADERRHKLTKWGVAITAGFFVLRLIDVYGDPNGWSIEKSAAMTIVSFFNTQKYPPSLLFLMMTLGPALLALSLWDRHNTPPASTTRRNWLSTSLITYGRVPLFFYLLQWPTAHAAGYVLSIATGRETSRFFAVPGSGQPFPPGTGFDLWVVYAAWIAGVLILYPVCRWYAGLKARRKDWWLSYL